ncbi:hypothetical protein GCM10010412_069820 [Nonomuraea recticatena]|uniref:Uncharacterized protein n=1 Tax=Nonomuraea recticatena TaxID=46178 RepID=A0ABP6F6I5_9ACTN
MKKARNRRVHALTHIPPLRTPEGRPTRPITERCLDAPERFSVISDRYFTGDHDPEAAGVVFE